MSEHLGHRGGGGGGGGRGRVIGKLAVAVAAAVGVGGAAAAQRANAGLTIDLRATTLNGQPLPAGSTENTVFVAAAGDQVGISIFAVISGTNALNDEGFMAAHGSFHSTTGGLLGDLTDSTIVAPFDATGTQSGSSIDFDSDGDLDLGGAVAAGQIVSTFWIVRAGTGMQLNGVPLAGADPAAEEFLLGTVTFTALDAVAETETFINYVRRQNPTGSNGLTHGIWQEDAELQHSGWSWYASDGVRIVGVPEPGGVAASAAALAGLASLRLLARGGERNEKEMGQ
jgi:hypothetical protein